MSDISTGAKAPPPQGSLRHLGLSTLGVVFGDLGTSPLFTFKTILKLVGAKPDSAVILGVLLLVL
jgi:KUP system potassium uptake protein